MTTTRKIEDVKKVINGLEQFIADFKSFCGNKADWQRVYDALALLKAQEPRVMTWEEAQANVQDGPFIIFEVRDSTGSEVDFGVLVGDFYEMSEGTVLTVADFWMMKGDYGKRFRLWASRPTDEQREAVPWG